MEGDRPAWVTVPGNWIFLPIFQSSLGHEGVLEPGSQQEPSFASPSHSRSTGLPFTASPFSKWTPVLGCIYLEMVGTSGSTLGIRKPAYISAVAKEDTKGWTSQGLRMKDMEPNYLVQISAWHLPAGGLGSGTYLPTYHSDTHLLLWHLPPWVVMKNK